MVPLSKPPKKTWYRKSRVRCQVIGLPEMSGFDTQAIPSVLWRDFADKVLIVPSKQMDVGQNGRPRGPQMLV